MERIPKGLRFSQPGRVLSGFAKNLRWGKHPTVYPIIPTRVCSVYSYAMKTNQSKAPTFGDLIAAVYSACGRRRARGILRLAVNAHLVVFRGRNRYLIC